MYRINKIIINLNLLFKIDLICFEEKNCIIFNLIYRFFYLEFIINI